MFRVRMLAALGALAGLALTAPAHADVLEIGDDGVVKVRAGAGVLAWSDGRPVAVEGLPELPAEALTLVAEAAAPPAYAQALQASAARHGLSPHLLEALVWQESRWRADAVSPKGARGLAQLMPGTARELGVNAADPVANVEGGARYLRQQLDRFGGDVERALAAYNAGPGRVQRAGGVPNIAETRAYVTAVLGRLSAQTPTK